jgi:MFS family permease
MPEIQKDMNFSYTKVGLVFSITGFVWAFGTIIWATIGDNHGRRKVIVCCTMVASVFSWFTGTVHSLGQMLWVRGALGFFEDGPWGPANASLGEEAPAEKRAMFVSFPSAGAMVIGTVLGPIIAVKLMGAFGSWRPVFYIISIPSFILGVVCAFVMREPASVVERIRLRKAGQKQVVTQEGHKAKLRDVLKYKNVVVSTVNSIPCMAWLWIYTGFSALFLTKVHNLSMDAVGLVISASGLGGFIGMVGVSRVSDSIGRKPAIMISGFLCCLLGLGILAAPVRSSMAALAVLFFFWAMFGGGMFPLFMGPLPMEAVPPEFAGTAVGVPTAIGEILGAAALPALAGFLADKFGLYAPILMATMAGLVVVVVSLFYVETAPRKVARMLRKPTHDDHLFRRFRSKVTPAV